MRDEAARFCAACLIGLAFVAPGTGEAKPRGEGAPWVPALTALGDVAAPSPAVRADRSDQLALAPVLGVGLAMSTAMADPTAGAPALVEPVPAFGDSDETARWVPAMGFFSGASVGGATGTVASSNVTYTTIFVAPGGFQTTRTVNAPLRPGDDGEHLFVTPFVGLSGEVSTPGIQALPGRPRLFARADASLAFSPERALAREGIPDGLSFPDPPFPVPDENRVDGQGSQTSGTVETLVTSAGLGPAFTFFFGERRLRIKPSVEYLRESYEVTGIVARAIVAGRTTPAPAVPNHFIPVQLEDTQSETFHGIGPGLEIEMDAARAGPLVLAVFMAGRAHHLLGDRDVEFQTSTTLNDPALLPPNTNQTVTATWTFRPDPWNYLGSVGLRFRWVPED